LQGDDAAVGENADQFIALLQLRHFEYAAKTKLNDEYQKFGIHWLVEILD
jgi:hypothetical protein